MQVGLVGGVFFLGKLLWRFLAFLIYVYVHAFMHGKICHELPLKRIFAKVNAGFPFFENDCGVLLDSFQLQVGRDWNVLL